MYSHRDLLDNIPMDNDSLPYNLDFDREGNSFGDKVKNNLIELIEFIAIILAILVVIRFFIAEPHKVSGSSMIPNFHDGDYIITNKVSTKISDLKRGEVVILKNPRNLDQVFIKRVMATPQDKIMISGGKVYVNDQLVDEPYLPKGTRTTGGAYLSEGEQLKMAAGEYFVMGDNRGGSSDSREWGPIKKELVVGQAWLRYWPLQQFNLIKVSKASS